MEDQMEVRLKSLLTEVRDVLQVLSGRRESAPLRAVEPRANPEAGREGWSKVRAQLNLGRFTKVADMQQRWAEAHAVQPQTACKELVPDIVAHEREELRQVERLRIVEIVSAHDLLHMIRPRVEAELAQSRAHLVHVN